MKKSFIIAFCFAFLIARPQLQPFSAGGLWGFKLGGKVVIAPKYQSTFEFSNGRAAVRQNDKFGFIDSKGVEVIPCIYTYFHNFHNGIAQVEKEGNKWGLIDKTGKEVVPFVYDDMAEQYEFKWMRVSQNNKWGFIDGMGQVKIPFYFDLLPSAFIDNIACGSRNGKYGYIDTAGKEVIPFEFENIEMFKKGLAGAKRNGFWGMISKKNETIIDFKYEKLFVYNSVVFVQLNGKKGYCSRSGKEIIPPVYDYVDDLDILNGHDDGEMGIRLIVGLNKKFGSFNIQGQEICPLKYDELALLHETPYCIAKLNDKYGLIAKNGKELTPFKYDAFWSFFDGMVRVVVNGKWGVVNAAGKEIVPPVHNYLSHKDGKIIVKQNGQFVKLDKNGNKVN